MKNEVTWAIKFSGGDLCEKVGVDNGFLRQKLVCEEGKVNESVSKNWEGGYISPSSLEFQPMGMLSCILFKLGIYVRPK